MDKFCFVLFCLLRWNFEVSAAHNKTIMLPVWTKANRDFTTHTTKTKNSLLNKSPKGQSSLDIFISLEQMRRSEIRNWH